MDHLAAGAVAACTTPARVTRVDRGAVDALDADGLVRATISGTLLAAAAHEGAATVCVGDWIAVRRWPDGRVTAEQVLPRRSAIVRASVTPGTSHGQVLAANVDAVFVVEGLQPEPDLGRIERFLTLAWTSGTQPVVVLTKADLAPDADDWRVEVAAAAPGADVLVVSAVTGAGVDLVAALLGPGRTVALLGPSGAGKSTLVNRLAGAEVMATRALRADGKGRHTTAHRELLVLPAGGIVIDTPGLRSVGLADGAAREGALERTFADIDELAAQCRFDDCAHDGEPGCAVLAAVDDGALPPRRLESYRKLQKEAAWIARRSDARLRAEDRAKWRAISKSARGLARP